MPRTPRVVEDRREQIIDAAMRAFASKGFGRATNKDVANEAGITSGLIYYYFESKEALLKAILEERSPMQVVARMPSEMLEQPPEVFLPTLLNRVLSIVEGEQFVGLIRVMLPEVLHNPEVTPLMTDFLRRVLGFISEYLRVQIARGTVRDDINLDVVGHALLGSMITLVVRRQILLDSQVAGYTPTELVQALVTTILQGIQPR